MKPEDQQNHPERITKTQGYVAIVLMSLVLTWISWPAIKEWLLTYPCAAVYIHGSILPDFVHRQLSLACTLEPSMDED